MLTCAFLLAGALHYLSAQVIERTAVGGWDDKLLDAAGSQLQLQRREG